MEVETMQWGSGDSTVLDAGVFFDAGGFLS